jgi:hypothetical protein
MSVVVKNNSNPKPTVSAEHSLWVGHPATPSQQSSSFDAGAAQERPKRPPQADVLLGKLRTARSQGVALGLPDIMALGIAQHGARLVELRARGYRIENKMWRTDGAIHSEYKLAHDPERDQ